MDSFESMDSMDSVDSMLSIPLKKDDFYLTVCGRWNPKPITRAKL